MIDDRSLAKISSLTKQSSSSQVLIIAKLPEIINEVTNLITDSFHGICFGLIFNKNVIISLNN